jgi:hypothetical protein
MITLTPFENALRRALVDRVHGGNTDSPMNCCLSYKDLGLQVDPDGTSHYPMTRPPFRGLNEALGHVSMYEVEHGRPMLSAVVVNEDTGHPGSGFAKLARHVGLSVEDEDTFWRAELAVVVRFWSDVDLVLVVDAALDTVMEELSTIKQLVRRATGTTRRVQEGEV